MLDTRLMSCVCLILVVSPRTNPTINILDMQQSSVGCRAALVAQSEYHT